MTTLSLVTEQAIATIDTLNVRADEILPTIAAGAAQRERDRLLPFDAVAQIAKAGFFTTRIPVRYGGSGGSVKDVIRLLIRIAAADSNVAQALRPGFGFVEVGLRCRRERCLDFFNAHADQGLPETQLLHRIHRLDQRGCRRLGRPSRPTRCPVRCHACQRWNQV